MAHFNLPQAGHGLDAGPGWAGPPFQTRPQSRPALCATLVCLLVGVDPDTCLREHGHETRRARSESRVTAINAGRGAWIGERASGAAESAGGNTVARGLVAGAAARGAELSPAVNAKTKRQRAPVFTRSSLHLRPTPTTHLRAPDTGLVYWPFSAAGPWNGRGQGARRPREVGCVRPSPLSRASRRPHSVTVGMAC